MVVVIESESGRQLRFALACFQPITCTSFEDDDLAPAQTGHRTNFWNALL